MGLQPPDYLPDSFSSGDGTGIGTAAGSSNGTAATATNDGNPFHNLGGFGTGGAGTGGSAPGGTAYGLSQPFGPGVGTGSTPGARTGGGPRAPSGNPLNPYSGLPRGVNTGLSLGSRIPNSRTSGAAPMGGVNPIPGMNGPTPVGDGGAVSQTAPPYGSADGVMQPNPNPNAYNPYGTGAQRRAGGIAQASQGVQDYFRQHGQPDALAPNAQGIQQMLRQGLTQDQINRAIYQTTGGQGYSGFLHGDDRQAAFQAARGGGFYDPRTTGRAAVSAMNPNALVGKQLQQYNAAHGTQRSAWENSPLLPTAGLVPGQTANQPGGTRSVYGDAPVGGGVTPRGTVGTTSGDPRNGGMYTPNPTRRNPYGPGTRG